LAARLIESLGLLRRRLTVQKMHADEVQTDADLVRTLLSEQYPEWASLSIDRVQSSGTDNALYRLGNEMIVRLPRIHWAVGEVDKGFRWLPVIAPHLPVTIPVPIARGAPAAGYPWEWGIYPWLEGENPKIVRVDDSESLAADVAQFVRALHGIDSQGAPPGARGEPLAMRDEDTRAAIADIDGAIDTDAVTAVWEAALETPCWHAPPVWVHGDLAPGNLLLQDARLTAIIDWGGVGVGDPACDLIVAWNLLPASARELFRSLLAVDDATWLRGRAWALSVALIQLPYYKDTNPALADNARHVISEVLADIKDTPLVNYDSG
jgi:aminoglycoside phosphotransferase (APT) family kinase protein